MNNIGKRIYGFCNGFFGRDDYNDKIIVYETDIAICCTYIDSDFKGILTSTNFDSPKEKQRYIDVWSQDCEDDY